MFKEIILKIRNNYFEYVLYFVVASLFFGNAIVSIASVFFYFTLLFGVYKKIKFSELTNIKPFLLMSLYFVMIFVLLCFLSENFLEVLAIEKHLPFILFPLVFFSNRRKLREKNIRINVRKIFVICALMSFLASFFFGLWRMFFLERNINPIYITYKFLTDLFGVHQIYVSVFYVLAILFCFDFYYHKNDNKTPNKKYLIIGLILFIAVILLSSRTAILASIIVLFIKTLFFNKRKIKEIILILCSAVLLGLTLTFSIPTLKARVVNLNNNVSSYSGTSFRLKVWGNVIVLFKDSPVYGYGLGKSQEVLDNQYHEVNFRRAFLGNFNAHNQYLQSLLDTGVLGFVFLNLMLLSPFIYTKNKPVFLLFTILILIALVPESFLIRQNGIIFYCLFFSIFIVEEGRLYYDVKNEDSNT